MSPYTFGEITAADQFSEARHHADAGRPARFGLALGGGVVGIFATDWRGPVATLLALFLWEFAVAPALKRRIDMTASAQNPEAGLKQLALVLGFGSVLYSSIPAQLIGADSPVALYVSLAWLTGTLLHVAVYYSHAPILLATQAATPALLLVTHPFFVLPLAQAAPSSAALALMAFAIVQIAIDRNGLLRAMALRNHEKRAAEAANAAKSQFLANMSHELRTPLNAILGYAEIIDEECGPEHGLIRDDVRRIHAAGTHLLGLINEVLDFAKIDASELKLRPVWFNVAQWARDTMTMLQPLAERNGNRLELDVSPSLTRAYSDQARLRQCLINLAGNACKFTENGRVTVSLTAVGDMLTVRVSDTGIGMTEEQMSRLFLPFSQGDISISRKYGGTGLGLSITSSIAKLLGGGVEVESRLGAGSTFTLTVPLLLEQQEEDCAAA